MLYLSRCHTEFNGAALPELNRRRTLLKPSLITKCQWGQLKKRLPNQVRGHALRTYIMKGGAGGAGRAVICVHPQTQSPAARIDTYSYTCGLYVKSLLHTQRTPTISVEKRVAPREEGTKYLQFWREIFQCGGESPRRKGWRASPDACVRKMRSP